MNAATNLVEVTAAEAEVITGDLDAREKTDLATTFGVVEKGRRPREYGPALAALEKDQKKRAKRRHLDVVDRGLMDLVSVYRDAMAVAVGLPRHMRSAWSMSSARSMCASSLAAAKRSLAVSASLAIAFASEERRPAPSAAPAPLPPPPPLRPPFGSRERRLPPPDRPLDGMWRDGDLWEGSGTDSNGCDRTGGAGGASGGGGGGGGGGGDW